MKELQDNLNIQEDVNKLINQKDNAGFKTQIQFRDEFGNVLFERENITTLTGRRFVLNKLFNNNEDDNRRILLNNLFNIDLTPPVKPNMGLHQEACVCLFGVGIGGSGLQFGSVNVPSSKENNLYSIIPFRYVDINQDLSDDEKKRYALKVQKGNFYSYYLKTFEAMPEIYIKKSGINYLPSVSDNIPLSQNELLTNEDIEIYAEIKLKISADDIREYFLENSSLNEARYNELGLYTAVPSVQPDGTIKYYNIESFSKLCFNNDALDNTSRVIDIIYRIYI